MENCNVLIEYLELKTVENIFVIISSLYLLFIGQKMQLADDPQRI